MVWPGKNFIVKLISLILLTIFSTQFIKYITYYYYNISSEKLASLISFFVLTLLGSTLFIVIAKFLKLSELPEMVNKLYGGFTYDKKFKI